MQILSYLDSVVIVNETISVARFIERFAIFNAFIHYWKNSRFTIHKFVFVLVFTFIAVRRLIWTWASKVTFNIAWAMIQALKVKLNSWLFEIWPRINGRRPADCKLRWPTVSFKLRTGPNRMSEHYVKSYLGVLSITRSDTVSVVTATSRQTRILVKKAIVLAFNSWLLIWAFWIYRSWCCTICRLAYSICQKAIY